MIIEFRVANFRSIDDEQVLSFVASADSAHEKSHCIPTRWPRVPRLLRSAVIVGPNASGKSNFLSAINTLRELIVDASVNGVHGLASRYTPFYAQMDRTAPTTFRIDLLLERCRYRYHVSYYADRILHEELRVNVNQKSHRWFARHFDIVAQKELWEPFSPGMHGPREAWRKTTGSRSLFLTTAVRLNASQLGPLMHWCEKQLTVALEADFTDSAAFAAHLHEPRSKDRAVEVLRMADFAVSDIRMRTMPALRDTPPPQRSSCSASVMVRLRYGWHPKSIHPARNDWSTYSFRC
jgi:hypothetical protein